MPPSSKVKLTDILVSSLQVPTSGQSFTWDSHTQGLAVRVTSNGAKAYIAQGQCNGKTVRVTLARCSEINVKEARARCSAATLLMRDGESPVERKKAHKVASQTLQEVLAQYVAERRTAFGPLKQSTKDKMQEHVTRYLSDWAAKPICNITHTAVAQRFRRISEHAPVQANIVMGTLRTLCTFAANKSIGADGIPTLLPFNPVVIAFKGLAKLNHVKPRTRRIPTNKVGAVWSLLHERMNLDRHTPNDGQNAALLLGLMMTGARFNEMAMLRWDTGVFLDAPEPYIQFTDTKMHRTLKLPVTTQLRDLLNLQHERRTPGNPFVFVGKTRKAQVKSPNDTLALVSTEAGTKISAHDLRRTMVQTCETVGLQDHVTELLTGHLPKTVTGRHYRESEDLRHYLPEAQAVADWYAQQGAIYEAQQKGENVVQFDQVA